MCVWWWRVVINTQNQRAKNVNPCGKHSFPTVYMCSRLKYFSWSFFSPYIYSLHISVYLPVPFFWFIGLTLWLLSGWCATFILHILLGVYLGLYPHLHILEMGLQVHNSFKSFLFWAFSCLWSPWYFVVLLDFSVLEVGLYFPNIRTRRWEDRERNTARAICLALWKLQLLHSDGKIALLLNFRLRGPHCHHPRVV